MISFDFEYIRPNTLEDAFKVYKDLENSGKKPMYYGGGTEIISMARAESIHFDAVIDLKCISECTFMDFENNNLVIGSEVTLTQIAKTNYFPLLSEAVSRIADHTIQDKITLGGNLGGTIIYRESSLPLMISETNARIMGENGVYEVPFSNIFNGELHLNKGEFISQLLIDKRKISLPYNHAKKTKMSKIDYPLITLVAIKEHDKINIALTGIGKKPTVLDNKYLNNNLLNDEIKIKNTIKSIQNTITNDLTGSKEYKEFVLSNMLMQTINNFKEQ